MLMLIIDLSYLDYGYWRTKIPLYFWVASNEKNALVNLGYRYPSVTVAGYHQVKCILVYLKKNVEKT